LVNSAFHPLGVGESSISLLGWGQGRARSPVSAGRQHYVPVWQVALPRSAMRLG